MGWMGWDISQTTRNARAPGGAKNGGNGFRSNGMGNHDVFGTFVAVVNKG